MSARQMIDVATAAGIRLVAEGEKLIAECAEEIPAAIVVDLKRHKAEILSELAGAKTTNSPAPWPEPKITRDNPHFGADEVPSRYEAGWQALLPGCPSWATEWQWAEAIYSIRDLFGEWGAELLRLNWQPNDIFDRWHGLGWFLRAKKVTAIGARHAFLEDGRIFERVCR